jgi:hypothetical protein
VHTISIHAGGHSTFVDALMTCLDEKDEAEVISFVGAFVFNL